MYYRLAPAATTGGIAAILAGLLASADGDIAADRERMTALRRRRARAALVDPASRSRGTAAWPEAELAEALEETLGAGRSATLDVGGHRHRAPPAGRTGARHRPRYGARHARAGAGLLHTGLPRCSIRQGDAHALPFVAASFDVVVLDEVLCDSPQPATVIAEAVRVLRPDGRLLVLDRILPAVRRLQPEGAAPADGVIYENQLVTRLHSAGLRPERRQWLPGRAPDRAVFAFSPANGGRAAGVARTGTHD